MSSPWCTTRRSGGQVSLEDALALAGVTEEGLYLALAEQYDP